MAEKLIGWDEDGVFLVIEENGEERSIYYGKNLLQQLPAGLHPRPHWMGE